MIYLYIAISLTIIVLIIGIIFMAIGGKLDKKYSSKLMSLRVVLQAIVIALLALLTFKFK